MLVDDASHEEAGPLNEGLKAVGFDVVVVTPDARALIDRVTELAPDVIIIDIRIADARHARAARVRHRSGAAADRAVHRGSRQRDDPGGAQGGRIRVYRRRHRSPSGCKPILDVAVARFEQERALREELRDAKDRLAERKVIERAKGIADAAEGRRRGGGVRLMRKLAMDRNRRLADVAQQIVDVVGTARLNVALSALVQARRSLRTTLVQLQQPAGADRNRCRPIASVNESSDLARGMKLASRWHAEFR